VRGARHTRQQILLYTVLLAAASVLPWVLHYDSAVYGVTASVASAGFLVMAWLVLRDRQDAEGNSLTQDKPAKLAFRYSLIYLAVIFFALAVDRAIYGATV
jgi:protoheme IX farnesyltransferase